MGFSQTAGTAIVPTLSRIVLALAFITTGYHKFTGETTYTAEQATTLSTLGVSLTPTSAASPSVTPVRFLQDTPVPPASDPAADPKAPDEKPAAQEKPAVTPPAPIKPEAAPVTVPAVKEAAPPTIVIPAPDPVEPEASTPDAGATPALPSDVTYTGKPLYNITLLVNGAGWPNPVLLGWLAAVTELAGGIFLLIGFLSRIWGLGLAITMGVAFYLTSLTAYFAAGWLQGPLSIAATDLQTFQHVFTQLGLFVLAFGVFLTGAGPLSVDRLLFGRRDKGTDGEIHMDRPRGGSRPPQSSGGPAPRPL